MKLALFNAKSYDTLSFEAINSEFQHEIHYYAAALSLDTVNLAEGYTAICTFVNEPLDAALLKALYEKGVRCIALRCAGFNQVDLESAKELGIAVARVPAYSPYAVAEHTLGLILTLNRKIHKAYNRVRENNYALNGLLGFDLNGKTMGLIGTGKIGAIMARIAYGLGCKILAADPCVNPEVERWGGVYVDQKTLLSESDIISLHCPLMPETHHLINAESLSWMKPGAFLVNTSRGGLIDTPAVIHALKNKQLGALALDVYEEEEELFFRDHSEEVLQDDVFARLMSFPNVLITGHQAYFTREALANIATTTLENIQAFEKGERTASFL